MITPSFGLTATERVLPRLALDFTTATLDPRITFTRSGNTATVTDSTGVIVAVNANIPRFDYNPTTLLCNGLLIEESRTNALLNSLLDGTSLATQTVVVTAAATTLSFYGTGQIVLSGAHSATVTGTGAYPTRTTLTFTPIVGALILTVTGTVQFAQLELGTFATSFIPTSGSQVTRTEDVATMTGTNFSSWYNASQGAFVATANSFTLLSSIGNPGTIFSVSDGTTGNRLRMITTSAGIYEGAVGGASQFALGASFPVNTTTTLCGSYKVNDFKYARSASVVLTDTSGLIPTVNQMQIGNFLTGRIFNGHIENIFYYPQSFTSSETQAFSK